MKNGKIIQNISTIPYNLSYKSTASAIEIYKNKYIYTSNRGHDSIAIFEILQGGILKRNNIVSTMGKTPRHFCISKDILYIANQDSNNISVFKISKDGNIHYDSKIECDSPNFICEL